MLGDPCKNSFVVKRNKSITFNFIKLVYYKFVFMPILHPMT